MFQTLVEHKVVVLHFETNKVSICSLKSTRVKIIVFVFAMKTILFWIWIEVFCFLFPFLQN